MSENSRSLCSLCFLPPGQTSWSYLKLLEHFFFLSHAGKHYTFSSIHLCNRVFIVDSIYSVLIQIWAFHMGNILSQWGFSLKRFQPVFSSCYKLPPRAPVLSCIITHLNAGSQCGKSDCMQSARGEYPSSQMRHVCLQTFWKGHSGAHR